MNYSPEYVFRLAGILPPAEDQEEIPDLWELNEIFKNTSAEEMLEYVKWRAQRAREEKQRTSRRPGTAEA